MECVGVRWDIRLRQKELKLEGKGIDTPMPMMSVRSRRPRRLDLIRSEGDHERTERQRGQAQQDGSGGNRDEIDDQLDVEEFSVKHWLGPRVRVLLPYLSIRC